MLHSLKNIHKSCCIAMSCSAQANFQHYYFVLKLLWLLLSHKKAKVFFLETLRIHHKYACVCYELFLYCMMQARVVQGVWEV